MQKLEIVIVSKSDVFLEKMQEKLCKFDVKTKYDIGGISMLPNIIYIVHIDKYSFGDLDKIVKDNINLKDNIIFVLPQMHTYLSNGNVNYIILDESCSVLEFKIFIQIVLNRIERICKKYFEEQARCKEYKKIIAIGASTGGTEAVESILKKLPKNMPPILVVIHMPENFTRLYAKSINDKCRIFIKEASDNEIIEANTAYIAPGGKQMWIDKTNGKFVIRCLEKQKVNSHMPSVDVLFDSIAKTVGKNSLGAILTGMGSDGAKGLLNIRKAGGYTIGQDEKTSAIYGMPKEAYKIGAVIEQMSLEDIARLLIKKYQIF